MYIRHIVAHPIENFISLKKRPLLINSYRYVIYKYCQIDFMSLASRIKEQSKEKDY